jgi:hypothetical protein
MLPITKHTPITTNNVIINITPFSIIRTE